jgi:hypothetical protein
VATDRRTIIVALSIAISACDSLQARRAQWESDYAPVTLPGYADFRPERDSSDRGLVIFSYRLPETVRQGDAIGQVKQLATGRYPCYAVVAETPEALQLRCKDRDRRFMVVEELRFLLAPQSRRLFVLALNDVPWQEDQYEDLTATLEEVRAREP